MVHPTFDPGWLTSSNTHGGCESTFSSPKISSLRVLRAQRRFAHPSRPVSRTEYSEAPTLGEFNARHGLSNCLTRPTGFRLFQIVDSDVAPTTSRWRRFLSTTYVCLSYNCYAMANRRPEYTRHEWCCSLRAWYSEIRDGVLIF